MKDEMREEANMPGASRVIIRNILVLQEQIDPPAWSPVQEALWREIPMQIILPTSVKGTSYITCTFLANMCLFIFVCVCVTCVCLCDAGAAKRDSDANYPWMRDIYRDASRLPQWMNTSRPVKPA